MTLPDAGDDFGAEAGVDGVADDGNGRGAEGRPVFRPWPPLLQAAAAKTGTAATRAKLRRKEQRILITLPGRFSRPRGDLGDYVGEHSATRFREAGGRVELGALHGVPRGGGAKGGIRRVSSSRFRQSTWGLPEHANILQDLPLTAVVERHGHAAVTHCFHGCDAEVLRLLRLVGTAAEAGGVPEHRCASIET